MATRRSRDNKPLGVAELHVAAFARYPDFAPMAMFVTNAWGQGAGTAQSTILLAIESLIDVCAPQDDIDFEAFKNTFNAKLAMIGGPSVRDSRIAQAEEAAPEPEVEEPEEPEEDFATKMARLAAEAKAKPKRRRRS